MTRDAILTLEEHARSFDQQLSVLEERVYCTLDGLFEVCGTIAKSAGALDLGPQRIRALLLASDIRSRLGHAAEARSEQMTLHEEARPWPSLARHVAVYLVSSCIRLGLRVEAMRWVEAALCTDTLDDPPAWRAEALMVAAMFSVSRSGADYTLVEQAMRAVRLSCGASLVAATAANFAEVTSECGELELASHFADESEAIMRRNPEAASALSWESVARARLASSELLAAQHAATESLRLEQELGCCDVNGDPWLSHAEVLLERGDAADALAMLEHPRRRARGALSSWTNTRELRVRSRILAALHRWEEAYSSMVKYMAAYEHTRSIEGDRAVVESSAAVAVTEERRRAQHFERLSLTDPLTGLPNRRHAERWLQEQANTIAPGIQLCVAIADLDHFKRINDTHSHDAGDLVLQRFGALLRELFNTPDGPVAQNALAARLGGEEFLLAWSDVSIEHAMRRANAMCARLREISFSDIVGGMPVTASLGLACSTKPLDTAKLLRAADKCLYEAKRAGRDRVIGASLAQQVSGHAVVAGDAAD